MAHSTFWQGCRVQGPWSWGAGGAQCNLGCPAVVLVGPAVPLPAHCTGAAASRGNGELELPPTPLLRPLSLPSPSVHQPCWRPQTTLKVCFVLLIMDAVFVLRAPSKVLLWNYDLRVVGFFAPLGSKKN